jgi:hypothetical protein
MALDIILAEKGGVCVLIGDECCTYIHTNMAPDGSIAKALQGLTALSNELAKNQEQIMPLPAGWNNGLENRKE